MIETIRECFEIRENYNNWRRYKNQINKNNFKTLTTTIPSGSRESSLRILETW